MPDLIDAIVQTTSMGALSAEESGANEISKAEFAMASRWPKAYDLARTAGFRDLGSVEEVFFDNRATAD